MKVAYVNLEEGIRIRSRRHADEVRVLSPEELELFKKNFVAIPEDFPTFISSDDHWADLKDYLWKVKQNL